MEDPTLESFECEEYVRLVSDTGAWFCYCCQLHETPIYLSQKEGFFIWNRFELPCRRAHQVHPYCYRKWCKEKGSVGCPLCGVVPYEKAKKVCMECNAFVCTC